MSYDVSLNDPVTKETLRLPHKHFMTGGTYVEGGTDELLLNVTSNYKTRRENPRSMTVG